MINFIDENDFNRLALLDPKYYNKRWRYFKEAIDLVCNSGLEFSNGIELGCYKFSILRDCDIMDKTEYIVGSILHDANIVPWNIPDKKYDIFIALQVLEHLKDQKAVFREIQRISNNALISLPYKWPHPEGLKWNRHYGIDEDLIFEWTGRNPDISTIVDNRRIINFYRFDR